MLPLPASLGASTFLQARVLTALLMLLALVLEAFLLPAPRPPQPLLLSSPLWDPSSLLARVV